MDAPAPRSFVSVVTALVVLLALAVTLPFALAHEEMGVRAITVVALEGEDCRDNRTMCFYVTEGNLTNLTADTTVQLTFRNNGTTVHNLAATRLQDADMNHTNTSLEGLFAGTAEEIAPGNATTFFFHIPANAEGVYFWCHVVGHEAAGMWLGQAFEPAGGGPD